MWLRSGAYTNEDFRYLIFLLLTLIYKKNNQSESQDDVLE